MSRLTLVYLIWQALKECGMDYVTIRQPTLMEQAMPFLREAQDLQ